MGVQSLNNQLTLLVGLINTYRDGMRNLREVLEINKKRVEDALAMVSGAETEWEKAKMDRDQILIDISRHEMCIEDLEAERRMIERKLAEIRVENLAKEPL